MGGGVFLYGWNSATLRNCTVADNSTVNAGGGVNRVDGGNVKDCVIVNNSAPTDAGPGSPNWSSKNNDVSYFSYCASPQACGSTTITNGFAFAAIGDYHLTPSSTCVDAGPETTVTAGRVDLDGGARVSGSNIDIGCYELDQSILACSGVWVVDGRVDNCLIARNVGQGNGNNSSSAYEFRNNIVYDNSAPNSTGRGTNDWCQILQTAAACQAATTGVSHNCFGNVAPWGTSYVAGLPKPANVNAGDFSLSKYSPCLDAGLYRTEWHAGQVDLLGHPRVVRGKRVDLGAIEYNVLADTLVIIR